jgi:hypothetical protein
LFNIFLARRLPFVEIVVLVLHVVGVFVIIIPLWVCQARAGRIGGTHEVIFEFEATSGWQPLGLAGTIGMVPMIGMLIVRQYLYLPSFNLEIASHVPLASEDYAQESVDVYWSC